MNAMVNYRRTFVVKYAGYVEDGDNEAGFGEAECPIKVGCVTVAQQEDGINHCSYHSYPA